MTVFFDLDGTLIDPSEGLLESARRGLAAVGQHDPEPAVLHAFLGPPLQDAFADAGVPADHIEAAVTAFRAYYRPTGIYQFEVYPGVAEMLADVAAAGHRLAVATSKPEEFAHRVLTHAGLDEAFDAVAGATLDGSRRAKADVLARAVELLGPGAGGPGVMVGDRGLDVRGAAAVGLPAIGAAWGHGTDGELQAAGAAALAARPRDVPPLIPDLIGR